jgi:predicted phosphodiesterase
MRFQLLSDLHIEFGKYFNISKTSDYLLLAGDIGYPEKDDFEIIFNVFSKIYKKIFYVAGNHEYYQQWKKGNKHKSIEEINEIISTKLSKFDNVYFLNNNYYDLELENIRILGTTLWFYPENNNKAISDYYAIPNFSDKYALTEWEKAREFISKNISNEKKNIVLTHHLPTYKLISQEYLEKYNHINFYFASNCEDLMCSDIKVWACGHSHGFMETDVNGVKCVLNAIGYPKERFKLKSRLDYYFDI